MPKLVSIDTRSYAASACYDWSVAKQLTSFPLRHWNLRNLTLQQECYLTSTQAFFRTFARLYNAAASPASRLRSAGSLAVIVIQNILGALPGPRPCYLINTGAQPKAGTGHKMQTVSVVFILVPRAHDPSRRIVGSGDENVSFFQRNIVRGIPLT